MGTCYTLFIIDEFDWSYVGTSKNEIITKMKKRFPTFEIYSDVPYWIIWDIGKRFPCEENEEIYEFLKGITYDKIYYQEDNSILLKEFRRPKHRR
jgi:hypothetical protein